MRTMTSKQAETDIDALLDIVQEEPVMVTRDGQPVAFVVSPLDMERLQDARRRRERAVFEFDAWMRRAAPEALPDVANLQEEDIVRMVRAER